MHNVVYIQPNMQWYVEKTRCRYKYLSCISQYNCYDMITVWTTVRLLYRGIFKNGYFALLQLCLTQLPCVRVWAWLGSRLRAASHPWVNHLIDKLISKSPAPHRLSYEAPGKICRTARAWSYAFLKIIDVNEDGACDIQLFTGIVVYVHLKIHWTADEYDSEGSYHIQAMM